MADVAAELCPHCGAHYSSKRLSRAWAYGDRERALADEADCEVRRQNAQIEALEARVQRLRGETTAFLGPADLFVTRVRGCLTEAVAALLLSENIEAALLELEYIETRYLPRFQGSLARLREAPGSEAK